MIQTKDRFQNRVNKKTYVVVEVLKESYEIKLVAENTPFEADETKEYQGRQVITLGVNNLQNFIYLGKTKDTLPGKSLKKGGTRQVGNRRKK